jgi:hypothetical protein
LPNKGHGGLYGRQTLGGGLKKPPIHR